LKHFTTKRRGNTTSITVYRITWSRNATEIVYKRWWCLLDQ